MIRTIAAMFAVTTVGLAADGRLFVGWSSVDVTPDRPVALAGQMHTRISTYAHDPITATALAIETRGRKGAGDQAIMISLDAVGRSRVLEGVRAKLAGRIQGFDLNRLLINSTHTHTAPETEEGIYDLPPAGGMRPTEYLDFLTGRLAEVAVHAWESRKPASVSWGLGHAVVGYNRRAAYLDGKSIMYGNTDRADFSHIEGFEDHGVQMLFFWDQDRALTGIGIHLACPSQQVEGEYYISADFWDDVRRELHRRYAKNLYIYAMAGASGDQSPRPLYRKRAEARMRQRRGLTPSEEIARRIANAVDEVLEGARRDAYAEVPFVHKVETLRLPVRKVTQAEYDAARTRYAQMSKPGVNDPARGFHMRHDKNAIERFESQKTDPYFSIESHIIRIGEVAIATNPFELFLDFGVRIEARSRAEQTFVVQLACGSGQYLPTSRAIAGGSYSTAVGSNMAGPEGGQVLVERTLELINSLWPAQ